MSQYSGKKLSKSPCDVQHRHPKTRLPRAELLRTLQQFSQQLKHRHLHLPRWGQATHTAKLRITIILRFSRPYYPYLEPKDELLLSEDTEPGHLAFESLDHLIVAEGPLPCSRSAQVCQKHWKDCLTNTMALPFQQKSRHPERSWKIHKQIGQ